MYMFYDDLIEFLSNCKNFKELVDYNSSFNVFLLLDRKSIEVNGVKYDGVNSLFVSKNFLIISDVVCDEFTDKFNDKSYVLQHNEMVECFNLKEVEVLNLQVISMSFC